MRSPSLVISRSFLLILKNMMKAKREGERERQTERHGDPGAVSWGGRKLIEQIGDVY